MMSQIKAPNVPSHSYKNPKSYYQSWKDSFDTSFKNSYLANETRGIDSDLDSERSKRPKLLFNQKGFPLNASFNNLFQTTNYFLQTNYFFLLVDCLLVCLENLAVQPNYENLAVQPNSEKPGRPNSPTNKKIFLSSFKYDLLNKHAKRSDQQMGGALPVLSGAQLHLKGALPYLSGAHPYLSGADFKIMKVCSIILFIVMTLALNALLILTASMGTLFLKNVIFLYGWIPAHMQLVTAAAIFMINILCE